MALGDQTGPSLLSGVVFDNSDGIWLTGQMTLTVKIVS